LDARNPHGVTASDTGLKRPSTGVGGPNTAIFATGTDSAT